MEKLVEQLGAMILSASTRPRHTVGAIRAEGNGCRISKAV